YILAPSAIQLTQLIQGYKGACQAQLDSGVRLEGLTKNVTVRETFTTGQTVGTFLLQMLSSRMLVCYSIGMWDKCCQFNL
uniref:Uncharacterized protein n=1 Tax=Prolemur simus TaxID=1328070 RepID=A0A8C9DTR7_PROSS